LNTYNCKEFPPQAQFARKFGANRIALNKFGVTHHEFASLRIEQLTILTACRTNKVLGATWDEFDLEKGVWKIPPHRMKAAKEHRVPLSQTALDLLNGLIRIHGNSHVFPGAREGKHLSNMSMLMGLRRMCRTDLTMPRRLRCCWRGFEKWYGTDGER